MAAGDLTGAQRAFLDRLGGSELAETFYLTGGTALAAAYLHHRRSEDLDLFSRHTFDAKAVVRLVNAVAEEPPLPRRVQDRLGFIVRMHGEALRIEFVHYDFECIEPPTPRWGRVRVDGLRDILANKLSALVERTEPKDFADLVFLVRRPELSLAQGIEDCRRKFGWPGLDYLLQTAFLRVEKLPTWPVTEPQTTLDDARALFRDLARSLVRIE